MVYIEKLLHPNNEIEKLIDKVISSRYRCDKRKIKIKTKIDFNHEYLEHCISNIKKDIKLSDFIVENDIFIPSYDKAKDPIIDGINNVIYSKIYNNLLRRLKKNLKIKQTFVIGRDCNLISGEMIGASTMTFEWNGIRYTDFRKDCEKINKSIEKYKNRNDFQKLKERILKKYDPEKDSIFCDIGMTITQPYFLSKYLNFKDPKFVLAYYIGEIKEKEIKNNWIKIKDYHENSIYELEILDNSSSFSVLNLIETDFHPIEPYEKVDEMKKISKLKHGCFIDYYVSSALYCISSEIIRKTKDLEKGIEKINDKLNDLKII